MGDAIEALTARCQGILLGRTTFEAFEPAWSTRTEADDPSAPFFNDTRKYVVSGTLSDPTWRNSTAIGAYDAGGIRKLKDDVDGEDDADRVPVLRQRRALPRLPHVGVSSARSLER